MKIFLSALEQTNKTAEYLLKNKVKMKYNLMSYFYVKGKNEDLANRIRDNSELILIDSGAHSFQFGKKVNWEEYTIEYANFIKRFDRPNVVGYFEMDVDNIIGYDKVLELRKILEKTSDKIIPVWHPNRGIKEFKKMCQEYHDRVIAIGGFKGTDIKDEQYLMFVKYARKYNCKVHCLGMTRAEVLDKVPFDYTDSSSWVMSCVYGRSLTGKKFAKVKGEKKILQIVHNYMHGMRLQEHYYNKWKKECKD